MTATPARYNGRGRDPAPRIELTKLFDKLPPHALEAEAALLGSMILDWQVIGDVVQVIRGEEDFYRPAHGAIYRACVDLYEAGSKVDLVLLLERLKEKGVADQIGGVMYLLELAESMPSATSATYYATQVRKVAKLRRLIETAGRILHEAYTSGDDPDRILDAAEGELFKIAGDAPLSDAVTATQLMQETYAGLEAADGRAITGLETGFLELDDMTRGLQNGELVIVAARPSMGKTALALNMAAHIAVALKAPVVVFTMEMPRKQIGERLLCSRAAIDSGTVRRNALNPQQWERIQVGAGELSESPLYIDDQPSLSALQLRAKARRYAQRFGIKAVFVDYLQLMSGPKSDSREQEVSAISRGIKALARELNVPVVCLSQLNRGPENREGHRPRMSDLRESGAIEQDADAVILLHREDYYHQRDENQNYQPTNVAEVIVGKQRNGPTGTVKLAWHGPTMRFANLATASQQRTF